MKLSDLLPDGLVLMEGEPEEMEILLTVEPLVIREFDLPVDTVNGKKDGFRYTCPDTVKVYVRALEADFIGFDLSMLSMEVDVSDYAARPGTWTIPVKVDCSESIFTVLSNRSSLRVTVEEIIIPTTTEEPETTEQVEGPGDDTGEPTSDPSETLPSAD